MKRRSFLQGSAAIAALPLIPTVALAAIKPQRALSSVTAVASTLDPDDYEEGEFTAPLRFETATGTEYGTAVGQYTRLGRIVTYSFNFIAPQGASGGMRVSGLPFLSPDVPYPAITYVRDIEDEPS